MFQRIYLAVFILIYLFIIFYFPSVRVFYKTKINPYEFKNTESAHDFVGRALTPITFSLIIIVFLYLFFPVTLQYFAPFSWLEISALKISGFVIIHLSLIWIVIAELQMGNSWRIGIGTATKTKLITTGLFSVSRNPVFLGMITTLTGLFLILPNAITLLTAVATFLLFQVQIRLEEDYLFKIHGSPYKEYYYKVRRWL